MSGRALDRVAGALGIAAGCLLVWAVVSSADGFSGYSPLRHFISQLVSPYNPLASRVTNAFLFGGGLAAVSMAIISARATTRAAVWTARSAAVASASLVFVGVFDFTAPVVHFGFAIATGAFGIAACVGFARVQRNVSRAPSTSRAARRVALAVRAAVYIQVTCLVAGLAYAATVYVRIRPGSLQDLLFAQPRSVWVSVGGTFVNPICVAEWLLFAVATALLVAASAAQLRGSSNTAASDTASPSIG